MLKTYLENLKLVVIRTRGNLTLKLFFISFISFMFLFYLLIIIIPGPLKQDSKIEISKGVGSNVLSSNLYNQGAIYWVFKPVFKYSFRVATLFNQVIPGEFLIPGGASIYKSISTILDPKNLYYYKFIVIEGSRVGDVLNNLKHNSVLQGKVTLRVKEGMLMPDTYFFLKGETRDSLINRMQISQKKFIDANWDDRDSDITIKNKDQAIILASLVEQETASPPERPMIAAVFYNRLKLGMKLQTDPTVAYGVNKPNADGLTKDDLKNNNPYNTYIIEGLTPTAISVPSRESIMAVLHPAKTQAIFFVAKGNGEHVFTDNLVDHNKAVQKWRQIEKDYRNAQK